MADRFPTFLTISEFLREYPVGRTRFYEDVRAGRMRVLKSGTRSLIPSSELSRLLDETNAAGDQDNDNRAA